MPALLGRTLLLLLISITILSCADEPEKRIFYALGTLVEIRSENGMQDAVKAAADTVNTLENRITSFEDNYTVAEDGAFIETSENWRILFDYAAELSKLSGGRFDISTGGLVKLYGFPEGPYRVPSENEIEHALTKTGIKAELLTRDRIVKVSETTIDTGAYSKGFIVDKAAEAMMEAGETAGIVNAGGDLYAFGEKNSGKWRIAVKHPDDPENILTTVLLKDKAIATSGDYERFFERDGVIYHHILNAKTGKPARLYKSVSVIAESCMEADGLATVYFLLPPEEVEILCEKLDTPVMLYKHDRTAIKLCGWGRFET
ncbi:FAD:protein FMN transferase [Limisalsivibrio acetivorans]|uniref:FAD:protein FMN transferase n=1 Tax=Limisalsivibrio acetivorans TaxID=1304888 RepID=UPI0003B5E7D5|nr:FAD:protein FMN transferase [Limisalsivibrio acetivorans]